jgi:hypothetical protein
MAALERSVPQPAPGGQIKVDMSLVTCKQYLSSDAERRNMIAAWMSGYLRASRSQPVFDFQRYANNRRALSSYCKKRGGDPTKRTSRMLDLQCGTNFGQANQTCPINEFCGVIAETPS